jgi:hypothetical protein
MSAALKPRQQALPPARSAVWLAWGLWLLVLAVNIVTFVLFKLPEDNESMAVKLLNQADPGLPMLVFATVGGLIVARRPSNVIGWLCWAIGLAVSLSAFGSIEAARTIAGHSNPSPVVLVLYQLGQVLYLLPLLGLLPLLVLLFPTGRLPSRRWRPVVWVFVVGLLLYICSVLFKPDLGRGLPANPLGLEGAEGLLGLLGAITGLLFAVFLVLVLGSLLLRFRRARGDERQQLKWFTFAAALLLVLPPTLGSALERLGWTLVGWVFAVLLFSLIPAAIGVALLRYRLYDIDRIINRTLTYGLLTVLLVGGYTVVVLGLGQLLGRDSSLVVAIATLAVAAVFQPARRRVQAAVDRRFNRRRYNAAQTITAFSARLREEIDLDTLSAELVSVIDQTMQPTTVSLWLRPRARGRRTAGA